MWDGEFLREGHGFQEERGRGGGNSVVASRVKGGLKKVICQSTANKGGIIRIILSLMKASDDFIAT